ncbi:hypothetical protein DVA67_012735 [Solirubrobacter sp. CPCC 204708]|uniref:Lipoprotein n=1 Tax=Solirubrobacter deserti TaxID=2282478 RepID=A0ABT4RK60_9ACTN|nr:hypothetical protein [Solirubrobacter deserti]MBE2316842.1 hypothetical protein [Solirubrobacter deserti]MDA0138941.1 hypothetical protein [Solirubrobacter deserti]
MAPSPEVVRQRRIAAVIALAVAAALLVLLFTQLTGSDAAEQPRAAADGAEAEQGEPTPTPEPLPELPRGGRTILPDYRVVAYYGAPQDDELGALGIGSPASAVKRLNRQAKGYDRKTRPVMPALELIATVAAAHPGDDGQYILRQSDTVIRRYLKAARKAKALLILDIQPGRADFFSETKRLRKWLKEPDVSLALDPEWRMGPNEVPGKTIGSVSAREVNATTDWLNKLTKREKLPQKLVLIHQFTDDMIPEKEIKERSDLAIVFNVDGFGTQTLKVAKYNEFTRQSHAFRHGFKLFYKEDQDTMSPAEVMRLQPRPDVVVYE